MTVVHPNHIVGINSITVLTGDSLSVHKSDGSLIRTIVSNTGISTFHAVEVSKGGGDLTVGVSTFFVDNSAGRVGINSAIPQSVLDVHGGADAIAAIKGTSTAARLDLKTNSHHRFWQTLESDGRFRFYDQTNGKERFNITSAGDVGISTAAPASKLHLYDAASDGLILQSPSGLHYIWAIQAAGNLNNGSLAGELAIRGQSGVSISANNGTGTQLRLTSDGRLRLGASTDEDIHTGEGADLQVVSTDAGGLTFARDDTTVSNGANLGVIRAYGNDNDGTYQEVAKIEFQADLNHGTGDKPGRLVFSTTSDGQSSTTERMRITSAGRVNIVGVCSAAGGFIGDGSALTGVSAGVQTALQTATNAVVTLDLSKQDHKLTLAGICTVDCKGGTEGDAHTVRIINSGIATVGFSTYFLFPSGAAPVLPSTNTAINQISFTVHHVGAGATQLLAGASLNYG